MQIERRIIIGLIVSQEYLQQIRDIWNKDFLEDSAAQKIAGWCWEYFNQYGKAPGKEIEHIFLEKAKTIPKDLAEEIEEDILPGLSEEYENEDKFNLDYLLDQTHTHFTERHLILFQEHIQQLIDEGKHTEAEEAAGNFKPLATTTAAGLDLSTPILLDRIAEAFDDTRQIVLRYPKQLGDFWNSQMVRGGFVSLMASEKRGKTFMLLDMAMRACSQKQKVIFFQAGDMTEGQLLKRMCIYQTMKSDQKKYSGEMNEPVRDCVYNQLNTCDKTERECDFGLFKKGNQTEDILRKEITIEELLTLQKDVEDYRACFNCDEYKNSHWGTVWLKKVNTGEPLTVKEAQEAMSDFFIKANRKFKLSSYANGTLSIREMKAQMAIWERQEGFVPDVIVVDYADLLVPETKTEFRHQQNEIWKGLRNLSQEKHALVITATQADAKSYDTNRLKMSNFSEDKRKYAHVTALYGLNQDPAGREKKLGILRINEIVVREGDYSNSNEVYVLQNLRRGRPFIASYW